MLDNPTPISSELADGLPTVVPSNSSAPPNLRAEDVSGRTLEGQSRAQIENESQNENQKQYQTEPNQSEIVADSLAVGVLFALVLTVLTRIVGFGRGILFCKFLTDQQLGQWSMVWSMMMLLSPLAVLGLPGCFGRYTEHYRQRGQLRTFFLRITAISVVMTLLTTFVILLAPETMSWIVFRDPDQAGVMVCVGLALFLVTGLNFLVSMMESLRQVRLVTIMRFVLGVMFAIAGCGLMMVWKDGTSAAIFGYAIACLVAGVPAIWFLWKNRSKITDSGEPLTHKSMWKRIAPFALWLWWSNMFHNMFEVADRYMLIHWSPVEAAVAQSYVGQYHSGRIIPLLLISVSAILAGVLMPYMSNAWESGKKLAAASMMRWAVKLASIVFTAGGLVVLLGAPILFDWILEGRYNDGLTVLPMTMVYCIWFGMFTLAQEYLWVAEKGKFALLTVGIGLLTNIGLNVLLIPSYGLWGAVMATAAGNLVNILITYGFNHRFGCKLDMGLAVCSALPLLLLLPLHWAVAGLAASAFAGWFTNFILSADEKRELRESTVAAVAKLKAKLGKN